MHSMLIVSLSDPVCGREEVRVGPEESLAGIGGAEERAAHEQVPLPLPLSLPGLSRRRARSSGGGGGD